MIRCSWLRVSSLLQTNEDNYLFMLLGVFAGISVNGLEVVLCY